MSSQIQNFYPNFAPNQVLTDTQLNHMRIYLDEQNRLTRTRMIGTGIICGLQADYIFTPSPKPGKPEIHTIKICKGYGVSSEGYLIESEGATYNQYRIYTGIDADEDGRYDYDAWADADNEIYELVPVGGTTGTVKAIYKDDTIQDLVREKLDCRVLVLYLECKTVDLKSCVVTDCSNKGEQVEFNLKALLVHEDDLEAVLPNCRLNDKELTSLKSLQIYVPRFHTAIEDLSDPARNETLKDCKLLVINETKDINEAYMDISVDYAKVFIKRMLRIVEDNTSRDDFLKLPNISSQLEQLADWFDDKRSYVAFNQYHFAMIRDLACGFNEFLEAYCMLVKTCCSPTGFSKHLMLRRLIDDIPAANGGRYRNDFKTSPVRNVMYENYGIARDLFMRLISMIETFREKMLINYVELANNSDGIRVTPSHEPLHPLGQQAIPYYYRVQNESLHPTSIVNYWQSASCCMLDEIQSYYYHGDHPPQDDFPSYSSYPLYYNIQKHSFYRIEGHLGMNCDRVRRNLEILCKVHNLEFDVLVLYTKKPVNYDYTPNPDPDTDYDYPEEIILLEEFAAKKWGLEYMGGVKPGGTFVLICDPRCEGAEDDIVVADFALACCIGDLADREPINICPIITDLKQNHIGIDNEDLSQYEVKFEVETIGSEPKNYIWNFDDGTIIDPYRENTIVHTFERKYGEDVLYLVEVTIQGEDGCPEEKRTIEVKIPMICPTFTLEDKEGLILTDQGWKLNLTLNYDVRLPTGLRPNPIQIRWGDDSPLQIQSDPNLISHTYPFPESETEYEIVVEGIGPKDCKSFGNFRIKIPVKPASETCPEIVDLTLNPKGINEDDPTKYTYEFEVSTIGPDPSNYIWDFGNGTVIDPYLQNSIIHDYTMVKERKEYLVKVIVQKKEDECPDRERIIKIVIPGLPTGGGSKTGKSASSAVSKTKTRAITPATNLDKEGTKNLNARRQSRIQSLYKFNEGGTYSRNRTYQSALEFVGDDDLSAAKLNSAFKDVLGKLKSVYKRANGQKEKDYQSMLSLVMQSYMDRLVEIAPSALPTEAKQTLTDEVTDLKSEYGIKAATLKKAWKAADIKKVTDAKVVDQINKLIK